MSASPVLFAHTDDTVRGGGEIMLERLARFARPYAPVELALVHGARKTGSLSTSESFDCVHSLSFPRKLQGSNAAGVVRELARYRSLLKRSSACVSFSWEAALRSAIASLGLPLPLLWFCQREPILGGRVWQTKARLGFAALRRRNALIVAPSVAVRADLLGLGYPERLTLLIRNGIAVDEVRARALDSAEKRAFRQAQRIPQDAFVVCCPARLDPSKDQATLLKALRVALESKPNLYAVCLGEAVVPGYSAMLAALSNELGVSMRVSFPGHQTPAWPWLGASDAVALPSLTDAAPLALLEAAALGLPIVATNVGGTPELVIHERTGLLFAPKDATTCAALLVRLASEPLTCKRLGGAVQRHCHDHFDAAASDAGWETVIAELLDRNRGLREPREVVALRP